MDHSSLNTTIYVGYKCLRTAFKIYKNIIYLPSLIHSTRRKAKTRIPQRKSKNKTSTSVRRLSLKRNSTNQKANSKIEIVFLLACFGFLIQSNKFSKRTIKANTHEGFCSRSMLQVHFARVSTHEGAFSSSLNLLRELAPKY